MIEILLEKLGKVPIEDLKINVYQWSINIGGRLGSFYFKIEISSNWKTGFNFEGGKNFYLDDFLGVVNYFYISLDGFTEDELVDDKFIFFSRFSDSDE